MVPGPPFDCGEAGKFGELLGDSFYQGEFTIFRDDEQQILIRQQDKLTMTEVAPLPLTTAILQIDAGEIAIVETVGVVLVNDEVVEVRVETLRRPTLSNSPSTCAVRN